MAKTTKTKENPLANAVNSCDAENPAKKKTAIDENAPVETKTQEQMDADGRKEYDSFQISQANMRVKRAEIVRWIQQMLLDDPAVTYPLGPYISINEFPDQLPEGSTIINSLQAWCIGANVKTASLATVQVPFIPGADTAEGYTAIEAYAQYAFRLTMIALVRQINIMLEVRYPLCSYAVTWERLMTTGNLEAEILIVNKHHLGGCGGGKSKDVDPWA